MVRLFVAVWPPASVADLLEKLPRPDRPGVRWTTRAQWHVTLRFLGRADVDEAVLALEGLTAPQREVVVAPTPEILGGSVLVLPVEGLDDLAGAVVAATAGVSDAAVRTDFRGHITLARSRSGGFPGVGALAAPVSFGVREVALVTSETRPDGARYRDVRRFPLPLG